MKNPNWTRLRKCQDCGREDQIRKDNPGVRCASCSGRVNGSLGIKTKKASANHCSCTGCGCRIKRGAANAAKSKANYCSKSCMSSHIGVIRTCKMCNDEFRVVRSVLSSKTNSSANFCGRPCYEKWLCNAEKISGRGSQWVRIRDEAIARAPFCGHCGTMKRLHVHHIVPYRLTRDNRQRNLIPLCPKCHKRMEYAQLELENAGFSANELGAIVGLHLRTRQYLTAQTLKRIAFNVRPT